MATDSEKARLAAANILLERGIRFTISDAPWYLRLFRLNKIRISPLKAGTIIEISRLLDEAGLSEMAMPCDVNERLDILSRIISVAVLNRRWKIRYLSGVYTRILLWHLPATVISDIFGYIQRLNRLKDFMITTRYFAIQAEMMMSPKNQGQVKGS
jgi:hypothetical protein